MISPPAALASSQPPLEGRAPRHGWLRRLFVREWHLLVFASTTMVALLSPATYDREVRRAMVQAVSSYAWQALPGYALLSVLGGAVLTHIIAVSAASYGLSHLALEAVVRVYVVELLPLVAALFVAMRSGLDFLGRLARARAALHEAGDRVRQLRTAVLPVRDAVRDQAQRFLAGRGDRVVEADALDEAAVATAARIGDDDVVEGALLGAAACKANHDHGGDVRWSGKRL